MQTLQSLSTPTKDLKNPSRFTIQIPDGWQQGRGAFGGLVLSIMTRALRASLTGESASWPLRSLTAALCGPTQPGEAALYVELLRVGSGVATLAVRLVQNHEIQAQATAVFGKHRVADGDWQRFPVPEMQPWRDLDPLPIGPPLAPHFAEFFEFRVTGQFPFSGHTEANSTGWIKPKNPGAARDDAYIVALADAWWPATLTCFTEPRPMATISFTLEILSDLVGLDPEAPLYHTATSHASRGGYTSEDRKLWGEDGRLVAINHQTMVIIR
jgi:acyl-CoA thioesterase